MLPGLRKQLALALIQVLDAAFNATTNPDGTQTGHWTDDGGYARTLTIRGSWSADPVTYPQLVVYAQRGVYTPPAGNVLKTVAGPPRATVLGGVLDDSRLHCVVKAESEDEREQLSDLVDQLLDCELNASGVPYRQMLANRGVTLKRSDPDAFSVQRSVGPDGDPAHGPVVYQNDLVYRARSQITYVPTPVSVSLITVKPTISAPSFDLFVGGTQPPR